MPRAAPRVAARPAGVGRLRYLSAVQRSFPDTDTLVFGPPRRHHLLGQTDSLHSLQRKGFFRARSIVLNVVPAEV
jgi:hypothetical protein